MLFIERGKRAAEEAAAAKVAEAARAAQHEEQDRLMADHQALKEAEEKAKQAAIWEEEKKQTV